MAERTQAPTPKVTSATVAGALVAILVWAASIAGLEVPAEVAAAVTVLITFGVAYLVPDKSTAVDAIPAPTDDAPKHREPGV